MNHENETLRWPTNLDHAAILRRLLEVRQAAEAGGFAELAAHFAGIEAMSPAHLGACVIAAMTLVQERPEQRAIATQLEIIALNLKNL
jgi:hypothetical protein